MKRKNMLALPLLFLATIAVAGCTGSGTSSPLEGKKITIYRSPSCGCCSNYADYASAAGMEVNMMTVSDMDAVKRKYNVPSSVRSCHTIIIGDYFVEGHVPVEAVEKLIQEHPDIDGIALPGMPSGSPGMPGSKTKKWTIYSIKDGKVTEFTTI